MLQTSNKSSGSSVFSCFLDYFYIPYGALSIKEFFCLPFQQQGYVIGNPGTETVHDINSRIQFAHGMALISDELYEVQLHNLGCFCLLSPRRSTKQTLTL